MNDLRLYLMKNGCAHSDKVKIYLYAKPFLFSPAYVHLLNYAQNEKSQLDFEQKLLIEEKIFQEFYAYQQKKRENLLQKIRHENPFINKLQTYINERWS